MTITIARGDVVEVDLAGAQGAEKRNDAKSGGRPCIIVQNEGGNRSSPLTIIVPLTDAEPQWKEYPQQVYIGKDELPSALSTRKDSVAECGHIRTVDRASRIKRNYGPIDHALLDRIDAALKASLGIA